MIKLLKAIVVIILLVILTVSITNSLVSDEESEEMFSFFADVIADVATGISGVFSDLRTSRTDTTTTVITATSTLSEKYRDFRRNPSNWEMTDRETEPATDRRAPGGIAIEEEWTHISTGLRIYIHDVQRVDGRSIRNHPHPRPYSVLIARRR